MNLPRVAVTQEQAEQFYVVDRSEARRGPLTVRLSERPRMPCPECDGTGRHGGLRECSTCGVESGFIPIPEGTRVEVGGWEDLGTGEPRVWNPVATATVDCVTKRITVNMDDDFLGEWEWLVTLTDIELVEEQ